MPGWKQGEARITRCSIQLWSSTRRSFSCSRAFDERFRVKALRDRKDVLQDVQINGWIRSIRRQKRVTFVALDDGSSLEPLQAVLSPEQSAGLSHGAAVSLKGAWVVSAGKSQSNELQVTSITIQGDNDAENNPIQPKYQTAEFLRTVPHLRAQVPTNALLLQLRSKLVAAITRWFDEQDFVQCHTPVITSSDCEGAGEVFTLLSGEEIAKKTDEPFFRAPKYLTVSAQLHLEALAQAVDKVWTLSPTFRAEKSDTARHLSEFYMLETELCFTNDLRQVMDVVENMLRSAITQLRSTSLFEQLQRTRQGADASDLQTRWAGLEAAAWPRITYVQAVKHLEQHHYTSSQAFTVPPSYDEGLAAEHERFIATSIGAGSPVFVTDYPAEQKPFYMAHSSNKTAACFDLLVPDLCELAGGSLREHRLDALETALAAKGVSGDGIDWYKDLRRYGSVPHGGFGLGFDRLICYLAGVANVKDVVSFPRYYGRCDC